MTLGQALIAVKGFGAPEPAEAFERARALCDEMGGSPQLGTVLLGQFKEAGIDTSALASQLQDEGAKTFVRSWSELMGVITSKSGLLAASAKKAGS